MALSGKKPLKNARSNVSSNSEKPFFSIVLSTRDRPELFQIALQSVLEQTFEDKEIIVVIDGSEDSNLQKYRALETQYDGILFCELKHRDIGHGQSYAMNTGVHKSSGQYLCFLDDDDQWSDPEHLFRAHHCITASEKAVDVYYSNQKAIFFDGVEKAEPAWVDDLIEKVQPKQEHIQGSYFVDAPFLLSSRGFAHLNCSIFCRDFYLSLGGMDETIRYENDRDIYLRSIDTASVILYSTYFTSLHNIPDVNKKSNMSTVGPLIEKKLYQMRVFDKGISFSKKPEVVRFCTRAKTYELKHASRILAKSRQYRSAVHYARAALGNGFNVRWLSYTMYLSIMACFPPQQSSSDSP
ncbi:MAG: glycosyltransferase family 2 protein [Halioglobus sp.]|nr:glycosyltransferase family 2 protein [Halioglobus sp.]